MSSPSEAFRTQKRHNEVNSESDGNEKTEKRFKHLCPSQPVERAGINGKRNEHACAERDKHKVGHVRFSCWYRRQLRLRRIRFRLGRRNWRIKKR